MKTYTIKGYSNRCFYAEVKAKDKKDALKKAKNGEFENEVTENEDFETESFEVL